MWGSGMRAHGTLLGSEAGWLARTDLPYGRDAIGLADSAWAGLPDDDELGRARAYDKRRWLPNVYLEKTDRATMAASLEARVPYLDPAVAMTVRAMTSPPKGPIRDELRAAFGPSKRRRAKRASPCRWQHWSMTSCATPRNTR